jgi:hypothetical protein
MATVTPNFNWPVPTSTDLVKDGATAIEALGDSIDASLVDLKGGTTGQVLSKNSNTDMDFTWVTSDDANAIQNTIVDAKGDLIAATAADTPARLAVGTNGQILTADSTAATGLKWATAAASGGLTFITKSTASAVSSHTISNCFTSAYTNYRIVYTISAVSAASSDVTLQLTAGGTATTSGYANQRLFGVNGTPYADTNNRGTDEWDFTFWSSNLPASPFGSIEVGNPQVAANSTYNAFAYSNNSANQYFMCNGGFLNNTTQYDGIKILGSSGTFSGDFYVYGYQKA